jgi:ferredoxin
VNLYPLRSIYSAVADTGVSLSQLIVLTSGLFVPFGFLLMLVIRRRPLQYFIPLFSLVYALALEGLHLLFGYGAFDIDRPILGMLGALFGCGLCAETCPEVFSLRDDGFAEAAPGPVPETAQETAAEAMDACPTSAIEEG